MTLFKFDQDKLQKLNIHFNVADELSQKSLEDPQQPSVCPLMHPKAIFVCLYS